MQSDRRTRFRRRIDTERDILAVVNAVFAKNGLALFGMTSAAIEKWRSEAQVCIGHKYANEIADLLLKIGQRTELLADDSRDVFRTDDLSPQDGIAALVLQLGRIVHTSIKAGTPDDDSV